MAIDRSSPHAAVALEVATAADSVLLANLLELYIHDMSEFFPHLELGADGRFGYRRLPPYFSETGRKFPFIVRFDGRVAGFVLAKRGSPALSDPDVLDVGEFFILRQHRRSGIGRQAAFLLWSRLPGRWTVRVSEANSGALAFWRDTIAEFTRSGCTESVMDGESSPWRVFIFESAPQRAVTRLDAADSLT